MDDPERPTESEATLDERIAAARKQAFERSAEDLSDDSSRNLHPEWLEHGEPPERIGPFQIQRLIARGGSSSVFEAWQTQPPRRVAIKVLRDVRSAEAIRRFEYEGRLLAKLEHPNIVRIYEVGHWNDHHLVRPYIAMEFIGRRTLLQYASDQQHGVRQRIGMLIEVCQGVQHAHLRGIIHRDLKPTNIVVDDAGRPKVLDFGVSKAIVGDTTMHTVTGQWLGTPLYMSPEQFTADADSIDTRCDVYALGAVGYELLSGGPPFSQSGRAAAQVVRQICEELPPLLGRRSPSLRGDVETIIAKALQKQPSDRYQSVAAFAADLQRYLDRQPIAARRIGWWGVANRWARREPATAAATLISLSLAVLLLMALFSSFRESQQRAERQREQLYASNINLAMQAFYDDNLEATGRLLERHTPRSGETDLRGFAWYHLWSRLHEEERKLMVHNGSIRAIAFSPDGSKMVSCGDGQWCLWATTDWRLLHRHEQIGHTFSSVTFSPSGHSFFMGSFTRIADYSQQERSHRVTSWDVASGKLQRISPAVLQEVNTLALSPDGTRVFSGGGTIIPHVLASSPGEVNVFSSATLQPLSSPLKTHATAEANQPPVPKITSVSSLVMLADGQTIATAHHDAPVRLWDLRSGSSRTIAADDAPDSASVDISPDGRLLAIGNWNEQIVLWDLVSERIVQKIPHRRAHLVRFSPDGRALATTSNANDFAIYLWDLASGAQIDRLAGHTKAIHCLQFQQDGKKLVSGSEDHSLRVWDLQKKHQPMHWSHGNGEVPSMAVSADRGWLAYGTRTGSAIVWNGDASIPSIARHREESHVWGVAFDPRGRQIAFGFADLPSAPVSENPIRLYRLSTGELVREVPNVGGSCSDRAFSSDGRWLGATYLQRVGGNLTQLQVWDTQSWRSWKVSNHSTTAVNALAFSPDCTTVISCGDDRRVRQWDAASGAAIATSAPLPAPVVSVAYSPNGSQIAVGTWPRDEFASAATEVRLLDAITLETQHVMLGHTGGAYGLGFSPDGKILASGAAGGLVKLWDLRTHTELATLQTPGTGWVFEVQFSSDGRSLYATYGSATSDCGAVRFDTVGPDEIEDYQQRCRGRPNGPH